MKNIFNRKKEVDFYGSLSVKEKKKILERAVRKANKEQLELVRDYRNGKI